MSIPNRTTLFAVGLALLLPAVAATARTPDTVEDWTRLRGNPGYRLDVDVLYDRLKPHDLYGDWTTATATLYVKTLPRFTPFVQVGLFEREDTHAGVSVGSYADWTSRLSSYTSFTTGGRSHYQQRHRWDHVFALNTGPVILVGGGGWLEDWDGHEDWYLAGGPRVWRGPVIAEYRLTRSVSDPGGYVAWKHLLSIGWGEEGRIWIFANLTLGRESYAANWVAPPQHVEHDFTEVTFSLQRWVRPRLGVKAQAGWLDLGTGLDGYRKLSLGLGGFVEF